METKQIIRILEASETEDLVPPFRALPPIQPEVVKLKADRIVNAWSKRIESDAALIRSLRHCADERGIVIRDILPGILVDLATVIALLGQSPHLDALIEVKRDVCDAVERIRDMREMMGIYQYGDRTLAELTYTEWQRQYDERQEVKP